MITMEEQFMIRHLRNEGLNISEISRQTGHDRKTVRKYIYAEVIGDHSKRKLSTAAKKFPRMLSSFPRFPMDFKFTPPHFPEPRLKGSFLTSTQGKVDIHSVSPHEPRYRKTNYHSRMRTRPWPRRA